MLFIFKSIFISLNHWRFMNRMAWTVYFFIVLSDRKWINQVGLTFRLVDRNRISFISESSIYFRGIAGINPNLLCVGSLKEKYWSIVVFLIIFWYFLGNHLGEILIFTIPSKGSNFFLKECRTSSFVNTVRLIKWKLFTDYNFWFFQVTSMV